MAKRRSLNYMPDALRYLIAEQYPEHKKLVGFMEDPGEPKQKKGGRTKYGNIPCIDWKGRKFDSKAERENQLRLEKGGARVLRQVSLIVSDGEAPVRMRIDHAEVLAVDEDEGTVTLKFSDTKGMAPTADWKNKAKALLNNFGIKINIIGRKK